MDHKLRVQGVMDAMSQGRVGPLFDAMAEDVTWRWMGVSQWSRTFDVVKASRTWDTAEPSASQRFRRLAYTYNRAIYSIYA